ncbi:MAG: Glu/Leu/Phe/Val dehydrogenase [Bernardetiaceae bacterium]|nr:Glu/Leu/Phe/Val dehydrogenase [Bernardetiaceae bacterium]
MTDTIAKTRTQTTFSIFDKIEQMGHEQITFCHDAKTGLKAIVGVHNTVLGPALGGTRMWTYASDEEALQDALRLSRGMTFKNAVAGLNLGGGKAVIIGDARTQKNEPLLRRYGKFIESLNGKYITAEDVGMSEADMEYIAMETKHVTGLNEKMGGAGDPSPYTALGTYMGIKAAAQQVFGNDSLAGKRVLVQGTGNVASHMIDMLAKENAEIIICDIFEDRLKAITDRHKVQVVGTDEIYDIEADVYAPCALGATVNDETLARLRTPIIAGCANNQLKDEKIHGDACLQRGIVYVPDFLINAGGVINVYSEYAKMPKEWVVRKTEALYDTCLEVIQRSANEQRNAQEVAIEIALERIDAIAHIKTVR